MKKLIFAFILLSLLTSFHPFHVGSLDILYNLKTKRIEITARIFSDDLENALNTNKEHNRISFDSPAQKKQLDYLLNAYTRTHLQMKINTKSTPLNYLGYETDREATLLYLESSPVTLPKKVEVYNTLLYNLYTDQSHLIHITIGTRRKSSRVSYPERYLFQIF